jgi:hypothetical protein
VLRKFNSFLLENEKLEVGQNSSKAQGEVSLSLEQNDSSGEVSDVHSEKFVSNFGQEAKYPKCDM